MITPEQKELIAQLSKTPYGRALQVFLDDKYAEIGNIMESKSWEETLGRQFALTVLKDLFSFMGAQEVAGAKKKNVYE